MSEKKRTNKTIAKKGKENEKPSKTMDSSTEESDTDTRKSHFWRETMLAEMSEEDWDRGTMSIRHFRHQFPEMIWERSIQKESYTFEEYRDLSFIAADFLRMFMAACMSSSRDRSEKATAAAAIRWSSDPKGAAMSEIKELWRSMQAGERPHRSDAQFARDMMKDYGDLLSEGGVKNAISRWRKGA